MDSNEAPDVQDVDTAIAEAKEAAQHLRDVAPGAIDDREPRVDETAEVSPANDGPEDPDASTAL